MFFRNLGTPVLALPRWAKRCIVLVIDAALCVFTVWVAYYLRLGEFLPLRGHALWAVAISICFALPIFLVSGLYRAIFRFSGLPALLAVVRAIIVYGLLYGAVFTAVGIRDVPRTVGIIQPILLLLFVGSSRAFARLWLGEKYQNIVRSASRAMVLVYGAGQAGRQLVAAMANSHEMQVIGFLDDDDRLHGNLLNGQPIYDPADLGILVRTLNVSAVLLAMPSLSRNVRNKVLARIRNAKVAVRTLPSLVDLAQGRVSISDLRELDIDDLLGRDPVTPNHILLSRNLCDKVVMVTGAGGSIGSELCRQILMVGPSKLLLIEQSEFALYRIHQELEKLLTGREIMLVPLLASVQDEHRLNEIMSTWHPNTVYHAAAYKHVPLVEHNPAEGIRNNVFGTLRTSQAAMQNGVSDFVLISTDKAVRPSNVMGASKRLAEMLLQAAGATSSSTRFSIVRFGNVLGSSGSVVPKFRQQIRDGGPITLTHPDITRYFMTVAEASQLVIQAGAMAKSGDVFVLDMRNPVKIVDLAHRMVELSGLTVCDEQNPDGDIAIEITGLRPGEKLHEELYLGDQPTPTFHPGIMKVHEGFTPWEDLEDELKLLEVALDINDVSVIRLMMKKLVIHYEPTSEIVDWVYLEHESEEPRYPEQIVSGKADTF